MAKIDILPMRNTIQNYAWGSLTAIAELLGRKPEGKTPQAELWMGAHPKAPSMVKVDNQWLPLNKLISRFPEQILGKQVVSRFGAELPFLFKVLAAAQPLSIQAHPDQDQARDGFERENRLGIDLGSPERNYKDKRHKPECLCALSPFWAMCGFRPLEQVRQLVRPLAGQRLGQLVRKLEKQDSRNAIKEFFLSLLQMEAQHSEAAVEHVLKTIRGKGLDDPVYGWIGKLARFYPRDMGILAPVLLNLVRLEPGQAIYLPAGQLHAYLEGVGVEIMANSDNVLRGGLTVKHIDIPELTRVVAFSSYSPEILEPVRAGISGQQVYQTPADEFELAVIDSSGGKECAIQTGGRVQILLCVRGRGQISNPRTGLALELNKGDSVLVPAQLRHYILTGRLRLFKATVP